MFHSVLVRNSEAAIGSRINRAAVIAYFLHGQQLYSCTSLNSAAANKLSCCCIRNRDCLPVFIATCVVIHKMGRCTCFLLSIPRKPMLCCFRLCDSRFFVLNGSDFLLSVELFGNIFLKMWGHCRSSEFLEGLINSPRGSIFRFLAVAFYRTCTV